MRGLQLRVENMERQHHQTMSFLSKALQNPGFLQQILQARGASQIAGNGCGKNLPVAQCFLTGMVLQQTGLRHQQAHEVAALHISTWTAKWLCISTQDIAQLFNWTVRSLAGRQNYAGYYCSCWFSQTCYQESLSFRASLITDNLSEFLMMQVAKRSGYPDLTLPLEQSRRLKMRQ